MTTFLLIHGGWHGGWAYRPLAQRLAKMGHEIYRPTLAGLAERTWESGFGINIQTHVDELKGLLDWENLSEVVLVAHSYGGFVATALADALPERFRALIYLDAFIPADGDAPFALVPRSEALITETAGSDGLTMTLPDGHGLGFDTDHVRLIAQYRLAHPVGTMIQKVRLQGRYAQIPNKAYVVADDGSPVAGRRSPFWHYHDSVQSRTDWDVYKLAGGHNLMLDDPDGVASILLRYAGEI